MKRLIKLQVRTIFHNKLFYVCLALQLLTSPIITYIGSIATKIQLETKVFPQIMSFMTNELGIISTIFVALFCSYDFNEGIAKNIVARGYSKTKLLLSKYIASLIGLLTMYGITVLVIVALFFKNGMGYEPQMLLQLIHSAFSIIAYTVIYGTIAFLLEKNGSVIITCLFAPNIITLILGLADTNLHTNVSKYWIDNVAEKFTANPIIQNLTMPIIAYLIYIVATILITTQILKTKEVK